MTPKLVPKLEPVINACIVSISLPSSWGVLQTTQLLKRALDAKMNYNCSECI
jgi:hypothetical protein